MSSLRKLSNWFCLACVFSTLSFNALLGLFLGSSVVNNFFFSPIHHFIRSMPRHFAYRHMEAIHITDLYLELLWWNSCKLDQPVITFFSQIFSVFWILSSECWWFWFPSIIVTSFYSQQITPCIWLKIFSLNISSIESQCVI